MATEQQLREALDRHTESLMARANVVGVGIVDGDDARPAIAAYVTKKLPLDQLRHEDVIPEHLELPAPVGGGKVPVKVIEQGPITLEGGGMTPEAL